VVFGSSPMAVYRIMSVRMQAFAEGAFRLLPTKKENKSAADIQRLQHSALAGI
jgi:hypothetical protein